MGTISAPGPGETDFVRKLLEQAGSFTPDIIVNEAGDVVEVVDPEACIERLHATFEPLIAPLGKLQPRIRALLDQVVTPQTLMVEVTEGWNALVGLWAGGEFDLGDEYGLEAESPSPVLPDLMVPATYVFSAVERVACSDGDSQNDCLVLRMTGETDIEELAKRLPVFLEQLSPEHAPQLSIDRMKSNSWVHLVTDPNTLIPRFIEIGEQTSMTMDIDGGKVPVVRTDLKRRWFTPVDG